MILLGDCLERLKELEDNSVDSVVTDPPYGLKFMGKKWDHDVPSEDIWRCVLRVLKPGGHLLSFSGTRTYHRIASNIELAGFEIRDQIQWIYGSGFPKSHDISKGIDKAASAERTEVVGKKRCGLHRRGGVNSFTDDNWKAENRDGDFTNITAPATDAAKEWQGWGTALKPANEPMVLARKPLSESTVAKNVLKWGVGGLNIDASRIESPDAKLNAVQKNFDAMGYGGNSDTNSVPTCNPQGRWPANLILDEVAAEMLDEQSGTSGGGKFAKSGGRNLSGESRAFGAFDQKIKNAPDNYGDSGGASRFFYVAKASKRERNAGLEGMPEKDTGTMVASTKGQLKDLRMPDGYERKIPKNQNTHPTVKPIKLMEYLIKLVTPPNGTVLDPFMGSGSTGVAAFKNNFKFIGIEMSEEYVEIAKKRIASVSLSG